MTNAALLLLHSMVSTASWAKTPKLVVTGGALSGKLEAITDGAPKDEKSPERKVWNKTANDFTLEAPDFQAALEATKFFVAQGAVPPTPAAVEILTELKLTE